MTIDEILTEISDVWRFADYSSAERLVAVNNTYYDVCRRFPWPFLEATTTLTTSAGDNTPTTPSDMKQIKALVIPAYDVKLQPERRDALLGKFYDLSTTGIPINYYFIGTTLYLYPTPDAVYSITMDYIKKPTALAGGGAENTILLPAEYHELLTIGAAYRLSVRDTDLQTTSFLRNMFEERLQAMQHDLLTTQIDRPQRVYMIASEDEEWSF